MSRGLEWDGEDLLVRRDEPTGATIVVAIHSSRLGPATGGTRVRAYPSTADAVADAGALARAMTMKFALAAFPRGGGKGVIDVPPDLDVGARAGLLRRYGDLLHELEGRFRTGPDVGILPGDIDVIASTGAPYVHALTRSAAGPMGSAGPTALGVVSAMEAVCSRAFGSGALAGRRVVVQGAGNVGAALLGMLREAGARASFSETDPGRARALRVEGFREIPSDDVWDESCDLLAPCALGGVLNARTIPRLRCRAIAGAANNQLEHSGDAARLSERGILWAPDIAASAGGAVYVTGMEGLGWTDEVARAAVRRIGETVGLVLDRAVREGQSALEAAEAVARERIALGPVAMLRSR